MRNLKKNLISIFNRKNYKLIIFLLISLIFLFLNCGNYNLVEGLSLNEKEKEIEKNQNMQANNTKHQSDIAGDYIQEEEQRRDTLIEDLNTLTTPRSPVIEEFNNCSSNFSNKGLKGDLANKMVNSQCENLEYMKSINENILKKNE